MFRGKQANQISRFLQDIDGTVELPAYTGVIGDQTDFLIFQDFGICFDPVDPAQYGFHMIRLRFYRENKLRSMHFRIKWQAVISRTQAVGCPDAAGKHIKNRSGLF